LATAAFTPTAALATDGEHCCGFGVNSCVLICTSNTSNSDEEHSKMWTLTAVHQHWPFANHPHTLEQISSWNMRGAQPYTRINIFTYSVRELTLPGVESFFLKDFSEIIQ
jgi:hypothetical protein